MSTVEKRLICIGGGELKEKETIEIDRYIADIVKARIAAETPEGEEPRRGLALFVPTASHDTRSYYNSFHKMYTGQFGLKTDVALTVYGEMDTEKIHDKFRTADMIYVGGGDPIYMLQHWQEKGMLEFIREAYERGALLCGLSAGAICWFSEMFTDAGNEGYKLREGLGWLEGRICPHYNERADEFDAAVLADGTGGIALENLSAIEFINDEFKGAIGSGTAWQVGLNADGKLTKEAL